MKLPCTRGTQVAVSIFLLATAMGCASNREEATPATTTSLARSEVSSTLTSAPGAVLSPTSPASPISETEAVATPTWTSTPTSTPEPTLVPPTSTPSSTPSLSPTSPVVSARPTETPTLYPYGVVYAYEKSNWTEADRQAIRKHLEYLGGLGVNTIVQTFSSRLIDTGREADWLILLDEAERANMQVIARLWPVEDWDGQQFDLKPVESFLDVVRDHPALLGYLGLHEPLERFDSDQLREFYAGVKNLATELAIAHFMGDMAIFETSQRFPNRDFSAGICDICIIWYYPAGYVNGQPVFEEDLVRETLQTNRELVDERAPDSQLWFLGQTYAQQEHRRQLRMPTPEEMETIYAIADQEGADGFMWYPWLHGLYDQVLSDPDMEPQQQSVRHIYETYILPGSNE